MYIEIVAARVNIVDKNGPVLFCRTRFGCGRRLRFYVQFLPELSNCTYCVIIFACTSLSGRYRRRRAAECMCIVRTVYITVRPYVLA